MANEKKRKTRVAVLGTLPPIRALSSYCFEFTRSLVEFSDVVFISFKHIYPSFLYPGGKLRADHTYPEISHPGLETKRNLTWYNPFSWFAEGLFTPGDILHAQWWSLPLFPVFFVVCACFKLRGKPVAITVHNVLPHEKSKVFTFLSSLLFRLGDHFIVHSRSGPNQMANHYGIAANRVSVVPHGSLDFHTKDKANRRALREEFGFSPDEKIILLFGAVRPYKGVDIALKAMPEILARVPGARLLVAGQPWEDWQPYEQLIRTLGIEDRVSTRLHYIPSGDVHKFFEACDLALFPYRHFDSQSGAGALAVSFRKPIVVSNVGGLPELVADRRFVFPPEDHVALARAVSLFFNDEQAQKTFARNVHEVSRKFDWKQIAAKTSGIHAKILRNRKNAASKTRGARHVP